ncbi:MAG TPA: hypothetical protein VGZ48_15745 [Candidatus Acidoferrales bacterium]|nr:hypothetical protein [Candidatus Acidoferrales bacterium]
MAGVSASRFASTLKKLPKLGGRQMELLQIHYRAPGRALNAKKLAERVGYRDYRGINIRYGLLAADIGRRLGRRYPDLALLVDFVSPKTASNEEYILVMHPEFAEGLMLAGWVR